MIPSIFFLGFNLMEACWFQIVQTGLDIAFTVVLLGLTHERIAREKSSWKKPLITGLMVQGVHAVTFFLWSFFVLYAVAGFVILIVFYFFAPYFIVHLMYVKRTGREGLLTNQTIKFYVASVPPSILLSALLSSVLFNLMGIENFFIVS